MNQITKGAAAVAASVGGVVVHRVRSVRGGSRWPTADGKEGKDGRETDAQWRVVTVNLPQDQVAPDGRLPEPLARLGDAIEVQIRPAPGDKGTELAVRLIGELPQPATPGDSHADDDDPKQQLRSALRQAKQILEVGEVLQADRPGTNKETITGKPLDAVIERSGGEGVL